MSDIERWPRERLRELQLERLREAVGRVLGGAPPLRDRLRAAGVESAGAIGSLDDLAGLPFTDKADLREHYPFGLLAVPREQLARVHASSGTGGKPTVVGYTAGDLEIWAEVMARSMAIAGVRPGMLIHNAYGYGLFTGGLGFHHGAERLGTTVLPISGGQTKRQVMLLCDLQAQVLCATPSYALTIAEALEDEGIAPERAVARGRAVRGRAVVGADARAARAPARPARAQLLRPVGDHRPRRRGGVRGGRRVTRQRGPLPRRGARPRDGGAGRGGRARRARHHDADQGGAAAAALPHGRHRRRRRGRPARAGARSPAWVPCRAAATTC